MRDMLGIPRASIKPQQPRWWTDMQDKPPRAYTAGSDMSGFVARDPYVDYTVCHMPFTGINGVRWDAALFDYKADVFPFQWYAPATGQQPIITNQFNTVGMTSLFAGPDGSSSSVLVSTGFNLNFEFTGNVDFCIECWWCPIVYSIMYPYACAISWAAGRWALQLNRNANNLLWSLLFNTGSVTYTDVAAYPGYGIWAHIAMTRSNGNITVWQNGRAIIGPFAYTSDLSASAEFLLNQGSSCASNFRITKGHPRYTAAFVPPALGKPL